ncbi:MAG: hypothetical protein HC915_09555, partial [Anaerolineae bacterium]|nr:hypothetical protein [Anaerolineae bacterium]
MQRSIMLRARALDLSAPFHIPPPAQTLGSEVSLEVSQAPGVPEAVLRDRTRPDLEWRVQLGQEGEAYRAQLRLPDAPTVVQYHFVFPDGSILRDQRQEEGHNTPVYGQVMETDFQIGVYDPDRMPPAWSQGMVVYQIFPDAFARGREDVVTPRYGPYGLDLRLKGWDEPPEEPPLGRDFYGGDLRGVLNKLDYLQALGVNCLYFCPIFAARTNHRYDATDYLQIDPMLGTEADFKALLDAAHARGIRVVLDAVYNHCSCDSMYFDMPGWAKTPGAYHDPQSPYHRWFHFETYPTEFRHWQRQRNLPEFVECPEVEAFFLGDQGVTAKWTRLGVDGWRTDVPFDNTDTFWRQFRRLLDRIKPGELDHQR